MAEPTKYGVLDIEGYWMGDESGPRLFDSEEMARVLATVLYEQFEHHKHFEVAPFDSAGKMHDSITARIDGHEAYRRAEGERPIRDLARRPPAAVEEGGTNG